MIHEVLPIVAGFVFALLVAHLRWAIWPWGGPPWVARVLGGPRPIVVPPSIAARDADDDDDAGEVPGDEVVREMITRAVALDLFSHGAGPAAEFYAGDPRRTREAIDRAFELAEAFQRRALEREREARARGARLQ